MQIPRLRVALVLRGDSVGGEEESGAGCCDGEEDAVATAGDGVLVLAWMGWKAGREGLGVGDWGLVVGAAWTWTCLRKDIVVVVVVGRMRGVWEVRSIAVAIGDWSGWSKVDSYLNGSFGAIVW